MTRTVNAHDSVETVVAAANAITSAEDRVQPGPVSRRRWKAWFGMYWCFGFHGQPSRISRAVLVPEPTDSSIPPTLPNSNQSSGLVVAPPSSPSSILQSEPPSTIQSPAKFFSLSALASNSYSPVRSSIFAIGPYANDMKLVSPPVFSTFTTEPSTAPFTPPEPVQQTTPSSPEVPFAWLLSSSFTSFERCPDSPIGHLISPGSVCSGTSSPFPEADYKIPTAQSISMRKLLSSRVARENGSILDGRITAIQPSANESRSIYNNISEDKSISFEFTAQEVAQRLKKKPETSVVETTVSPMDLEETITERIELTRKENATNHKLTERVEKEFKFNIETDSGCDKELGILHSDTAWNQVKYGFVDRLH